MPPCSRMLSSEKGRAAFGGGRTHNGGQARQGGILHSLIEVWFSQPIYFSSLFPFKSISMFLLISFVFVNRKNTLSV